MMLPHTPTMYFITQLHSPKLNKIEIILQLLDKLQIN